MATDNYVSHLKARLAEIDAGIARLKDAVHAQDSTEEGKSSALAQLAGLRLRHETLAQRIAEAEAKGAAEWSALHESFKEEADALHDTMERWLTKLT